MKHTNLDWYIIRKFPGMVEQERTVLPFMTNTLMATMRGINAPISVPQWKPLTWAQYIRGMINNQCAREEKGYIGVPAMDAAFKILERMQVIF